MIERSRVRIVAGEFSDSELILCADSYSVSVPPPGTAVARKNPSHSAKSADGRLHLNTHIPLTQRSRSGLTMPLSRHSVGTYPEMAHTQLVREHSATVLSQLAEPL